MIRGCCSAVQPFSVSFTHTFLSWLYLVVLAYAVHIILLWIIVCEYLDTCLATPPLYLDVSLHLVYFFPVMPNAKALAVGSVQAGGNIHFEAMEATV